MAFRKKQFLSVGGYKNYNAGDDFELPLRLRTEGKLKYDSKMKVLFSMRRYEECGLVKTLVNWWINVLKSKYNLNISVDSYTRKNYQKWAGDLIFFKLNYDVCDNPWVLKRVI